MARSVLFSNVRVNSFANVEDSVLLPSVSVERSVRLRRCVVDKSCTLPEGLTVGYDPDEDRRRFHVTEQGVTLITPEMLGQEVYRQR